MIFRKWGGGGSKAVWNFSKKSSVLVWVYIPKRPWLWGAVILLAIDKLIKSKHRVNFFHFPKKKFWRNFVIAGFKCTLWAAWILCQAKVRLQPVELQYVTFPAGWTDFISNFISLYRPNELSLPTHYSLFPLKEGMPFNFNLIDDRLSKKNSMDLQSNGTIKTGIEHFFGCW